MRGPSLTGARTRDARLAGRSLSWDRDATRAQVGRGLFDGEPLGVEETSVGERYRWGEREALPGRGMAIALPPHQLKGADRGREVALAAVIVLQVLERAIVNLGHVRAARHQLERPGACRPRVGPGGRRRARDRPGRRGRRRAALLRGSCRCRAARRAPRADRRKARELARSHAHLLVFAHLEGKTCDRRSRGPALFGRHVDIEKTAPHVEVSNFGRRWRSAPVELFVELERSIELLGIEMVKPFVARA